MNPASRIEVEYRSFDQLSTLHRARLLAKAFGVAQGAPQL